MKRRKSRDSHRDSNVVPDMTDLGFRKGMQNEVYTLQNKPRCDVILLPLVAPNSELYRHKLENYLRRIVEATENSTLLEMTALRFQLSCECQLYYDSEDKDALVAEIRKIVRNVEKKRLQPPLSPDSFHSLEIVPATPSTVSAVPLRTPQPRIIEQKQTGNQKKKTLPW